MPTIFGLRRRYTASSIRLFCDRTAVSKSDSRIDYSLLEQAVRDDLDPVAARSVAVLDPLKLVITNYPEGQSETCTAPRNPHDPEAGQREFPLTRELWIERDDFREEAPKKYFRLFPGNTVRLKYGYVVRCTGFTKNEAGEVVEVRPNTCRTPRAARRRRQRQGQGQHHLGQRRACRARADPSV